MNFGCPEIKHYDDDRNSDFLPRSIAEQIILIILSKQSFRIISDLLTVLKAYSYYQIYQINYDVKR